MIPNLGEIKGNIYFDYISIYLFGSYARGDFNKDSDIDILILSNKYKRRFDIGKYSYSPYTKETLKKMANDGSLFILHIIEEGKKLEGVDIVNFLSENFRKKESYESYRKDLRDCLPLLDINEKLFKNNKSKFARFQKYMIRSFIYSLSVDQGFNEFNINTVLEYLKLERFQRYFKAKWILEINYNKFNELNREITKLFECDIFNKDLSIEALIINNYEANNLIYKLGTGILKQDFEEIGYENIFIDA